MAKYRKKPVVVEAWKFVLKNRFEQPDWISEAFQHGTIYYQGGERPYLTIQTLEGDHRASPGDWIIRGVKGELYPCKPDVFDATYELASKEGR